MLQKYNTFGNNSTVENSKLTVDHTRLSGHCIFVGIEIT